MSRMCRPGGGASATAAGLAGLVAVAATWAARRPGATAARDPEVTAAISAPAAPATVPQPDLDRLKAILDRFEVSIAEASDLVVLQDYKIIIVLDDSGSMQRSSEPTHMRRLGVASKTRWQELEETATQIIEVATALDPNGLDVHFLNRQSVLGVRTASDPRLVSSFREAPSGSTPLTRALQTVARTCCTDEQPVLLFMFTDGEPDGGHEPFKRALRSLAAPDAQRKLRVQIIACTGDDDEIGWLNQLDSEMTTLDVMDDYYTERDQVLRTGRVSKFTRGDWLIKAMLGSVSAKFDKWDEMPYLRPKSEGTCSVQ